MTQKIINVPAEGFVWPNQPPKDCPFQQSKQFGGVYFTGVHNNHVYGDTWYPSWASDGNQYSPWTDGPLEDQQSASIGDNATTGNAVIIGDDPQDLIVKHVAPLQIASPKPYEGRYPCGSLVYNGVWYYGTYCLGPEATVKHEGLDWDWPVLGPMPGFRISTDYGKTWTPSPLSPEQAALSRAGEVPGRGEDGRAALRRFRQEHGAFARRQGVPGRHGRGRERSEAALRQFELDLGRSSSISPA